VMVMPTTDRVEATLQEWCAAHIGKTGMES
jgi:hypothetical protein